MRFNAEQQTVSLSVQVKQLLSDGKSVLIPPLVDVPVSYPKGGGFAVTFPLRAGDEGIAIFSERCIDGWFQSGNASEPLDYRLHDLSDAMFIPGISALPHTVKNFFTDGLSLQTLEGNTFIRITAEKISIKGDIEHIGDSTQIGSFHSTGVISSDTDISAAGISGKSHTHSGVESGNKKTGGPV